MGTSKATSDLSEYLPRVDTVVRVFWKKCAWLVSGYVEFDDLYHVGVIALLTCAPRWNSDHGVSFWQFASKRVAGALIDYVRADPHIPMQRASRDGHWLTLQPLADLEGGDDDRCLNTSYQQPVDTKLLSGMLASLYPREVEIIYLRYYEDVTLTEIGNRLGITEGRVHQIHDEIMRKLKRRLAYPQALLTPKRDGLVYAMVAKRRRRLHEQAERRRNHHTSVDGRLP